MATFQVQVEGLTGLSIGTSPTAAELAEYLKDGVIDVTSKVLLLRPQDSEQYMRGSSTTATNSLDVGGAKIISVIREAEADGDTDGSTAWRECRKVPTYMRSRVVDVDSLYFASKYNPVYLINNNGAVNVYPIPDGTNDGFRVYYVNNEPKGDGVSDTLAAGHTTIGFFPKDKVYLVVIYASIRSLLNSMSAVDISTFAMTTVPPDVPTLSIVVLESLDTDHDATAPTTTVTPVAGSSTYTGSAPTYTAPAVGGDASELSDLSSLDTDNIIDVHADQLEFDQWFATVGHFLEDEEDNELAAAQVQKISAYINAYSQAVASQVQTFNASNVLYQSAIQESLAEFQATNQANLNDAKATLQVAIDNKKRSEARKLQNTIKDMEAIIADNQSKLAKFQAETALYQAEAVAEIQSYQQEIAEKSAEYKWKSERLQELKQEYAQAFSVLAPKQPPQQPQQRVAQRRR